MTYIRSLGNPINRWFAQNNKAKVQLIVILGVLLVTAFLTPGIIIGNRNPTLLFLLYLLLLISIVFLRWPVLGLIAIFLGGIFVHFVGPSGLNAAIAVVALMMGLWILKMVVEQKKIRLIVSRTTIPMFAFILISLLAFGFGQFRLYSFTRNAPLDAQLAGLSIFILSVGAFLMVAHLVQDLHWLKILTWTFIILGAIYVIGRIIPTEIY